MAGYGTLDAVLLLGLALRHQEAMLLVPPLDLPPLPVEEHLDARRHVGVSVSVSVSVCACACVYVHMHACSAPAA